MITVAETPLFLKQASKLFGKDEHQELVSFLARNPLAGDVIQGTGGVRKVRFATKGKGKSGGARVIYFYFDADHPLTALMVYAKAQKEDLSPEGRKLVSEIAAAIKQTARKKT